uniref:Sodium/solute symporter n=1 Tax=Clastoptera arizonana TaxID=38151 RepID=A0A1B6D5H5_9HEMI
MSGNETLFSDALVMFNWVEYSVFGSMLGLSALIGFYFGCLKEQNTVSEYMWGGKKMGVFPVTMSLVASHVSGILILGVPAEIYTYGTQYVASLFPIVFCCIFSLTTVVPVFYKLQLQSPYEYFEMRFSYGCRSLASLITALHLISLTPLVIYTPALAFNQVTGISVHTLTPIVCLICILYTSFGGLKAVVWTDTLQSGYTSSALLFIIFLGCYTYGLSTIFKINEEGHRLEMFNMNPNIFERNTFWTVVIGYLFQWLGAISMHPGVLQRQITVSNYRKSQMVTIYSSIGFIIVKCLCSFLGLLTYTEFHDCDPVATGTVRKSAQLLPFYVIKTAKNYPGITGLFISGVVSAALSTMSAGLNTVAGTLYEDFSQIFLKKKKLSDSQASFIMKIIVVILGVICVLLIYIVEKFDSLLQIVVSLTGITHGPLVAMFLLGIIFPWTNSTGALVGAVSSFLFTAWVSYGAQVHIAQGNLRFPGKVTSIDNCLHNNTMFDAHVRVYNYTGIGSPVVASEEVLQIFKISYALYSTFGVILGVFVGLVVSFFTGKQDLKTLNPDLIAPYMRKLLPKKEDDIPEEGSLINKVVKLEVLAESND